MATNNPRILDQALFRRFDDVLHHRLPEKSEIERLIGNRPGSLCQKNTGFDAVVGLAESLSHAEIAQACDNALKETILADRCGGMVVVNGDGVEITTNLVPVKDKDRMIGFYLPEAFVKKSCFDISLFLNGHHLPPRMPQAGRAATAELQQSGMKGQPWRTLTRASQALHPAALRFEYVFLHTAGYQKVRKPDKAKSQGQMRSRFAVKWTRSYRQKDAEFKMVS